MQNVTAAHAALRTLRRFFASTAASGLNCHGYSSCGEGAFIQLSTISLPLCREEGLRPILHIPLHKKLCKRAPLGLHIARFSNGTETSMAVDLPSPNTFKAAEQGCASTTLEEMNSKEMGRYSEPKPSEGTLNMSSLQLPVEVHERLNHLDNMVEQHSRSLALLTSLLEAQKQSLGSILDEIKHLKMDPGCKVQTATLDAVDVSARGTADQPAHPWPEWTHFIEHLKSLPFFKELVEVPEVAGDSYADDSRTIKRMLAKFSQTYDYLFDALSVKELQNISDFGCPNDDRRTVASYKRLKDHFEIQKKSVELASVKPKLLDVMRLVYMIAELSKKDGVPDKVKLSIMHLLEEIVKLTTIRNHGHIARSETISNRAVLQNSFREKSSNVQAKLQAQGASSSSGAESLSGSDCWECPSFERHEKSDHNFDNVMPKSSHLTTSKLDTEVYGPGEEDKEQSISASERHVEMPVLSDNRQALTMEKLSEEKSLVGSQEQVLEACILPEKEEKVLGGAGVRDDTDADDHPDIFNDILNQGDTSSLTAGPKCSLSGLIRQNIEAFSSIKREREQGIASATGDHGRKGMETSADERHKYDDDDDDDGDAKQRGMFDTDDSDIESEDKYMQQSKGGGGCASPNRSSGIKHNQSSSIAGSLGKGVTGRVYDDDRRRKTKSMERFSRKEDSDAESEAENFVSRRTYGKERSGYNKSKHRGQRDGYSDGYNQGKHRGQRDGYSNLEFETRGGFDRRREGSSRSW